jgi:branched-chain amino acid transport system ATP-binding protein
MVQSTNSKEARALADTIADIDRQAGTVVLIQHNLGGLMRICQRLVVLDNGRKTAEGEPRTVMNDPVVRAAYLGADAVSNRAAQGGEHA